MQSSFPSRELPQGGICPWLPILTIFLNLNTCLCLLWFFIQIFSSNKYQEQKQQQQRTHKLGSQQGQNTSKWKTWKTLLFLQNLLQMRQQRPKPQTKSFSKYQFIPPTSSSLILHQPTSTYNFDLLASIMQLNLHFQSCNFGPCCCCRIPSSASS